MTRDRGSWTAGELHDLLAEFEAELRRAGLEETTIRTFGAIDAQAHSNDGRDAAVHEPDGIGLRPVRND